MSHPTIEIFTTPGWLNKDHQKKINEDQIVATSQTYAIFDGATPLVKVPELGDNLALFASSFLKKSLEALSINNREIDISVDIIRSNNLLLKEVNNKIPAVTLEKHMLPSSTVAAVRIHSDRTYSFCQVADSMILEINSEGVTLIGEDQFHKDDQVLIDYAIKECTQSGVHLFSALTLNNVFNKFVEDKNKLNFSKGVLNGDPNVETLMSTGRRSLENVDAIIIISDGFLIPRSNDSHKYSDISKEILNNGCFKTYELIKKEHDNDPNGDNKPRFKYQDDASCICLRFIP